MPRFKYVAGVKVNKLTYVMFDSKDKHGNQIWLFKCDCGNNTLALAYQVKNENTKSCGCVNHPDFTNQRFGMWLCLERKDTNKNGDSRWLCRCDCGTERIVTANRLLNGRSASCGCKRYDDIINQTFNYFTTIKYLGKSKWLCKCRCGNVRNVIAKQLKNGTSKSCGCYLKEMLSKRTGKNSPVWNHDLTDEERKTSIQNRKNDPRHRKWRKKVFIRDNYTCQCCKNETSGNLAAHHIYAFKKYKKLRYTVSNGVTLCTQCHKLFHKIYGSGNNTRKQFSKFKKNFKS